MFAILSPSNFTSTEACNKYFQFMRKIQINSNWKFLIFLPPAGLDSIIRSLMYDLSSCRPQGQIVRFHISGQMLLSSGLKTKLEILKLRTIALSPQYLINIAQTYILVLPIYIQTNSNTSSTVQSECQVRGDKARLLVGHILRSLHYTADCTDNIQLCSRSAEVRHDQRQPRHDASPGGGEQQAVPTDRQPHHQPLAGGDIRLPSSSG